MDSSSNDSQKYILQPKVIEYDEGNEILREFSPFIRVYRDGKIERLSGTETVPAGNDPNTGVQSKDVVVTKETNVSARLYMPESIKPGEKLPLLLYFHGGGFVVDSAFSPSYHMHLNQLVKQANIVVVSVDYRLAPEHPLPIPYFDSWFALEWVASHSLGNGEEPWLNEHVDFGRLFIGGDSAGGNIVHNVTLTVGNETRDDVRVRGVCLNHPMVWGSDASVDGKAIDAETKEFMEKLWRFTYPETSGTDDPKLNPDKIADFSRFGCERVLLVSAEHDFMKEWQLHYGGVLEKSGWKGNIEMMEFEGEGHVFYLFDPASDNALNLLKKMASFINQE
ncbi:hypothetical protein DCAR_0624133 [Daucus carota subsp. sativus]|uniref:Alpha/beta hydrolase fold-3 domain-containing protein n=1 Tax=Daucus carota subsp. sativus TaxID=79200 RepID=A0AAF0XAI3_DAUCS|nr:PREDICTED: probable carboxylesterase 5 [Daucus carota subsp. sativus]WOH04721.1 hypothetical protein DCAR_0624133 [Daucus carota subsp. sativus]